MQSRAWLSALVLMAACEHGAVDSGAARWQRAEALWRDRDVGAAWHAWQELDPTTPEGSEAHRRLAAAAAEYRRGIELLGSGAPGAREALIAGTALAPMDPALYLPLARAARERGIDARAAEFYRKYLSLTPAGGERALAQAELETLGGEPALDGIFEPRPVERPALVWAGAAGSLALIALFIWWRRRSGPSLAERAATSPELHPALAYLIGCLRHELLKHRIGAVSHVVQALADGRCAEAERAFLLGRLYRGSPISAEWRAQLALFERALGPRFALGRNERSFRAGGRAIAEIARLQPALARGSANAIARLARACRRLHALDAELQGLVSGLSRTTIDDALLVEVVRAVRSEYAASSVMLDELAVVRVPPGVAVEVYRVDLIIIIKNVVRNAILAVGRAPSPRRVCVNLEVALEPTGEELVNLHVRDTSPERLTGDTIKSARLERGLGLVNAALARYDGALVVEPAAEGFEKTVTVRLFRALDQAPPDEKPLDQPLRVAS